ncbi:MAG: alcohol dehydrogenase catalytic domain-containing protein [Firmicutes bacterium]|uniref:Iditol 2-dehydrogenase n=1 Tax=Sulfobacillus benefaciens TaxID=453960 RepID=A0A2T2X4D1_9FIRM|nr:alcohol dehydrogenase catalytic domain-containing protein [Bacillota bacterium]MCL5013995.1 alcohol dehydrogenase catalytic domain-containing protein [Bacillota bacterium]PSR29354.1 MAG: iditol 2-dehydrogenase [Sulfobacillus benefaciens]
MSYTALRYNLSLIRVVRQKVAPATSRWRALLSLRYERAEEPRWIRNNPQSVEIEPLLSGICGSDLALILGNSSPYLASLTRFPAVPGHEVVARVVKEAPGWPQGTRVVVNPSLSCASLAIKDACAACASGHPELCYNRGRHDLGLLMGFHTDFPGGFGERMWVPSHQLYAIPSNMAIQRAVLSEPLSIVLHGLSHVHWAPVRHILVIGSGPIGLLALLAIPTRLVSPELVMAVARYPQQQYWAKRLGAEVVSHLGDPAITEITGTPYPSILNASPWRPRGFDLVIDAAGSPSSLKSALACVHPGGQVLLLGAAGEMKWDFAPVWSRDISLYGTYGYGASDQTFRESLRLLADSSIPIEELITHTFALKDYKEAFHALWDKNSGAVKVCLKPH